MKEEIRDLMDLKGWTQKELAVEFGVSESTAWRWHEGLSVPIPAFQKMIAKLLKEGKNRRVAKQPA